MKFRLASREYTPENTIIKIPAHGQPVLIGEGYCTIIAGPCAVEDGESYLQLAGF
jgi:3-deoxy-7-phosphoheptulonate synthase